MDLALIRDGVVRSVARDTTDPAVFGGEDSDSLVQFAPGTVVAGQLWNGSVLSDPAPEPDPVPRYVSMRQARLALLGAGLLGTVNTLMATQPEAVQIEWQFATDIWRDRDLVVTLGAALGLTDEQIDALFIAAKAIP